MKFKYFLFALFLATPFSTNAGPFTDKLSICLVQSTSDADKQLLIQWVFAAMSAHPSVHALSNVSVKKGQMLNKKTANLFMTLLTVRCKSEMKQALKFEGKSAFEASFKVLGEVAMNGLMKHPNVRKYMSGLDKNLDPKKLRELVIEK